MNEFLPAENVPARASTAWTADERESFFAAITRHRRAAWQVNAVVFVASVLVALIVALLLSPLFYAALSLLLDIANLFVPTFDLAQFVMKELGPAIDAPEKTLATQWLVYAAWAALPGLIFMTGTLVVMRRAVLLSGMLEGAMFKTVSPTALTLNEQRFRNVAGEMAIAAGIAEPRVLIAEWDSHNAAVFGANDSSPVIVVSRVAVESLERAQLQAVVAHLIGSVANGDVTIGVRVATTIGTLGFVARLGTAFTRRAPLLRLMRAFAAVTFRPCPATARAFFAEVADPFRSEPEGSNAVKPQNDWRSVFWLPFAGPIFASGFFGGIISVFALEPLVSCAWRRRKYLADATAVRLTREPDALAEALKHLGGGKGVLPLGAWGAHLCVVRPFTISGMFGASWLSPFPSNDQRLRALVKLGANHAPPPKVIPLKVILIISPLVALAAGLMSLALGLLVWLSVALSALFLGLPFGALHLLLRWLGHG